MDLPKKSLHIDWVFLLAVAALIIIGLLTIYSTGHNPQTGEVDKEFGMQIVWVLISICFFAAILMIDYHKYVEYGVHLYFVGLALLIITFLVGTYTRDIRAWLGFGSFGIQPSEFMKLFTIITLARFLNMLGDDIKDLRNFFITFVIIIPPLGLISVQPDFGTALTFVPICFVMLFIAGARLSHIMSLIMLSVLGVGIPMVVAYYKEVDRMEGWLIRIFSNNSLLLDIALVMAVIGTVAFAINFFVRTNVYRRFALAVFVIPLGLLTAVALNSYLKPYQRKRIVIFVDPEIDYFGAGYNIIQSKIAIGAGGFSGRGYLKGSQSQLAFLPEKKTDFVYSSLGEEWGFLGSLFLLGLFGLFIYKSAKIVYHARDFIGSLVASGILAMFVFHIFVNIGMATGMMPVTGLPLPFISYGGSNLLMNMMAVGLLFNIEMRRYVH